MLVRGATVHAVVSSLDGLEAKVVQHVASLGGFTTSSERNDASMTVVFRVPAAKLDVALTSLESLAQRVDSRQLRADDFTEEFVDVEAQRTNLTATRDRLLSLLEKSARVEDALAVNKGLTEVQGEFEKLTGRAKFLQQAAAMSTVTATFTERGSSAWQPLEVARTSLHMLRAVIQFVGSTLIVVAVFSPLWGPLVWLLRRRAAR